MSSCVDMHTHAQACVAADLGVDSSTRFTFRAQTDMLETQTDRQTKCQSDATGRSTHATATSDHRRAGLESSKQTNDVSNSASDWFTHVT